MKVAVVAEYYPRRRDPVLGVWAHRQALAARDAGADVRVLVLERPVPPASSLRRPARLPRALIDIARQPQHDTLDGIEVRYVRFMAGGRRRSYAEWDRRARKPLQSALEELHAAWPFDLIHAHYALPAGGAAAGFRDTPLVMSVHGGDIHGPLLQAESARARVAEILGGAAAVLCNSRGTLERAASLTGSTDNMRVVHLGADPTPNQRPKRSDATVATVGHVIPRKRHRDVLDAIAQLPDVRWVVIGDGPSLLELKGHAATLGVADRVEFTGQLEPARALAELARCHVMALPSEDEAFGVAYVEALACGVPAIGLRGESGPEEIASLADGMLLVPPRDPAALAAAIRDAMADRSLPSAARRSAAERFSWERCGQQTVAAYEFALGTA